MAKRYYWLKLSEDWFKQKEIKKLRRIAGGDTYTIVYLKMLLSAIKRDGKLFFEGIEDDFAKELALDIDEDAENVQVTLNYLASKHLIEVIEADEYLLPEARSMTGSESESAERVRRHREQKKEKELLQCNTDVTPQLRLSNTEIEIEIEKEKRDIKTICPEPEGSVSGLQKATEPPTAGKGVKEIDTAAGNDAKGIGINGNSGAKEIGVKAVHDTKEIGVRVNGSAKEIGAEAMADKPQQKVLFRFPTNRQEQTFDVTEDYVREMQNLYPAVNADLEFRGMLAWLINNPRNRKTKDGMRRFINHWLSKAQNGAPRKVTGQANYQSKNRFNNFEQSGTDWDAVADQIMQSQVTQR